MSDAVINVESLGKRYEIRHQTARRDGLRHVVESAVRSPLTWLRSSGGPQRSSGTPKDQRIRFLRTTGLLRETFVRETTRISI
jgi:hypothetical protein